MNLYHTLYEALTLPQQQWKCGAFRCWLLHLISRFDIDCPSESTLVLDLKHYNHCTDDSSGCSTPKEHWLLVACGKIKL